MAAPRRFDHDEARALYVTGEWTKAALARRFGVSWNAIMRCVEPDSSAAAWPLRRHRERRQPCRGGCGRLVWVSTRPNPTGFCPSCLPELLPEPPHGTETRYTSTRFRCRCDECRAAANRARWERRNADLERSREYERNRKRTKAAA